MSARYPIVAITGSSGAGTTSVTEIFQHIFRREGIRAQIFEGDSMHRFDRQAMRAEIQRQAELGNPSFSDFGPEANLLKELEETF
ncbi:MAG: phosphoribulokinase, partial [Betaproteobacteria bacterium]|nr:phosphoribulokinase [Betaproteobacteria bacterium]